MSACLVVQRGPSAVEEGRRVRAGLLEKFSHVTLLHLGSMTGQESSGDPDFEIVVLDNPAPDLSPGELRAGVGILDFVNAHRFDEVMFYDCAPLAHACVVAKQTGILPPNIVLTMFVSSTHGQRKERDGTFISSLQELADLYFERVSICGCDRLVFGTDDALKWTSAKGWQLPSRISMMPAKSTELLDDVDAAASEPARVHLNCDPTITVVVTHYNRPGLLAQALSGLAQQTDKSFEVIVVDDGSSSAEAIDFLDALDRGWPGLDRLRLIRQENKYAGAARNEGLRHVHTSHVVFFDDDNVPKPNMIEVFRRAARLSGADIVSCQMHVFEDCAPPDPHRAYRRHGFAGGPVPLGAFKNCFGDTVGIYKRTVFDRSGLFSEIRGFAFQDWQIYLRAAMAGCRILSLPVPLFWYRITPGSLLRSTDRTKNYRVISSTLHEKVDAELRPLIDLMIGQYLTAGSPLGFAKKLGRSVEKRTQSIIGYLNRLR